MLVKENNREDLKMPEVINEPFDGQISLDLMDMKVIIKDPEGLTARIPVEQFNDMMKFLDECREKVL